MIQTLFTVTRSVSEAVVRPEIALPLTKKKKKKPSGSADVGVSL